MAEKRSKCPIANVLDVVGDRWSLLVIRDLVLGKRSFSEIAASPERIPPSTLTAGPGRQYRYELTQRGADLVPLLVAMMQWSARHDPHTPLTPALRKRLETDFAGVVESLRSTSAL